MATNGMSQGSWLHDIFFILYFYFIKVSDEKNSLVCGKWTVFVKRFIQSLILLKALYILQVIIHPLIQSNVPFAEVSSHSHTWIHRLPCYQEQLGVKYLSQGYIDMLTKGWDQTPILPLKSDRTTSQPQSHILTAVHESFCVVTVNE